MPAIKGVNRGAIRTLEDLKRRCVIDAINDCWIWTQGRIGKPEVLNLV